jgi:hypothetical protein
MIYDQQNDIAEEPIEEDEESQPPLVQAYATQWQQGE